MLGRLLVALVKLKELIESGRCAVVFDGVAQPVLGVVVRQVQEVADIIAVKVELDLFWEDFAATVTQRSGDLLQRGLHVLGIYPFGSEQEAMRSTGL